MYTYQYLLDLVTKQVSNNCINRLPDNTWIPNNLENSDWQTYQVWLSEGNTPLPPA